MPDRLSSDFALRFVKSRPAFVDLICGLLAGKPILHLKNGDEFILLVFRLIHFFQVMLSQQAEPLRGMTADQFPFLVELRFLIVHKYAPQRVEKERTQFGVFEISLLDDYPFPRE